MGRPENILVFQDTEKKVKYTEKLSSAVKYSTENQKLVWEYEDFPNANLDIYKDEAEIVVSKKRSFEAAEGYKGMKTCVLNFASATSPGGGVVNGSSAQEESLCRCSTLYFSLNTPDMWSGFYIPHRNSEDPKHNDDVIYTPNVCVFKTDTDNPKMMAEKDWYHVNVITCAAPNLKKVPSNRMNPAEGDKPVKMLDEDLQALHEKRLSRILDVAVSNGDEVIILGAFGCGAFKNDPKVVVRAMKNVVEKYKHCFKVIEFAVYCSPRDEENYHIFKETFDNKKKGRK